MARLPSTSTPESRRNLRERGCFLGTGDRGHSQHDAAELGDDHQPGAVNYSTLTAADLQNLPYSTTPIDGTMMRRIS